MQTKPGQVETEGHLFLQSVEPIYRLFVRADIDFEYVQIDQQLIRPAPDQEGVGSPQHLAHHISADHMKSSVLRRNTIDQASVFSSQPLFFCRTQL